MVWREQGVFCQHRYSRITAANENNTIRMKHTSATLQSLAQNYWWIEPERQYNILDAEGKTDLINEYKLHWASANCKKFVHSALEKVNDLHIH